MSQQWSTGSGSSRRAGLLLSFSLVVLGTGQSSPAGFTYVPVPEIAANATLVNGNPTSGSSGGGEHTVSWQSGIQSTEERGIMEMNIEFLQALGGQGALGSILSAQFTFDQIQSRSGDSVWHLAGYKGDGVFNLLDDPRENSRMMGRLEDYQVGQSASLALDPGMMMEMVGVASHIGVLVYERTDGASGSYFGNFPSTTAEITFENVYPSDGVAWAGPGVGGWAAQASYWTGGALPTIDDHTFIQTDYNVTVTAPSASTSVQSLTVGGGTGDVTLILDPVERVTSKRMTTVYGNGTLDLNGGLLVTDGLNLIQGADLQWNGGILFVVDDFLSVPVGPFVMDDPSTSALTLLSGVTMYKTDSGTVIGQSQNGRFLVTNGTRIFGGYMMLGELATGNGRLDVQDPGTLLDLSALIIGPDGYGIATIEDGAEADIRYLRVGEPFGAPTSNPFTGGDLVIRDAGTVVANGSVNVEATGTMEVSGGATFNGSDMLVAGEPTDPPEATFTGSGTTATFSNNVFIGPSNVSDRRGRMYIENGAGFYAPAMVLSYNATTPDSTLEAELFVSGEGTQMTVQDIFIMSYFAGQSYAEVTGGARVEVNGPTILSLDDDAEATLLLSGPGTQWQQDDDFWIAGIRELDTDEPFDLGPAQVTVGNGAWLYADQRLGVFADGTLNLTGGGIRAPHMENNRGGVFNMTGGELQLGTYVGDLNNSAGMLATVGAPSQADVTGDYTQGDQATLRVALGGLVPGGSFDLFAISGITTLDGTLQVVLDGGYLPNLGDSFEFLTAPSILGGFDTEAYPALPGGLMFNLTYGTTSLTLTVVDDVGIEGDLNGDGFVGIADLTLLLAHWNQSVPPGDPLADANGDGFVGIQDLNTVLGNWNTGTPPAGSGATIPEPATVMLAGPLLLTRMFRQTG